VRQPGASLISMPARKKAAPWSLLLAPAIKRVALCACVSQSEAS
jgi:hypothetical protein